MYFFLERAKRPVIFRLPLLFENKAQGQKRQIVSDKILSITNQFFLFRTKREKAKKMSKAQ